jgi:hypothetical protein
MWSLSITCHTRVSIQLVYRFDPINLPLLEVNGSTHPIAECLDNWGTGLIRPRAIFHLSIVPLQLSAKTGNVYYVHNNSYRKSASPTHAIPGKSNNATRSFHKTLDFTTFDSPGFATACKEAGVDRDVSSQTGDANDNVRKRQKANQDTRRTPQPECPTMARWSDSSI